MENCERICRFCFEKCATNFKTIEKNTHESLNTLLVMADLAISDEPVMCTNCSDILQNCLVFKKACLDTRNHTVGIGKDKINDHAVCEFCTNLLKDYSFTILNIEENVSEKLILEKYFPELDSIASKNPVICDICHGSLVNFFKFITVSSIVERKIRKYCEAEGINNTIPIKLNNVLQFAPENTWKENDHELDVFKINETSLPKGENEEIKIQGGICTLCLRKCEICKAIEGGARNVWDILFPKIDFSAIEGPMMCKNCEEMLIKCLNFRTTCLHTQNNIVSSLNNGDGVKPDIKDVYLSKNLTGTGIPVDQNMCRFCMCLIKHSANSLDVEGGDVMLGKMIKRCLPELDLSIIKKPVICTSCRKTLEDYFNFVTNCLIMGEKINKYYETPDISIKGPIEFSSSLPFINRNTTGNSNDIIKVEKQFYEDKKNSDERGIGIGENTVKLEQISFDDSEDAFDDIENKNNSYMEMNGQEVNNEQQFTLNNTLARAKENDKPGFIKTEEVFCGENETKHEDENDIEMVDQKFLFHEKIEIKTEELDFNRFENDIVLPQTEANRMHQCDSCYFQTKYKGDLRRHLLTHKDPSEVTMYRCDSCSYQTKHKKNLGTHSLTHKDPSELTVYECHTCSFQTKRKSYLKEHLLTHKDPLEITMYKCDSCLYQTTHSHHLKRHSLIHKDPSEVTMYKCNSCSYQTKHKRYLKEHLLTHKDPSELTVYKCDTCSFQTKRKSYLKKHLLTHKDPSEVAMFKCDSCLYQTTRSHHLKRHSLVHKDPSEVTMYKCDSCSYQTKRKINLGTHLLTHKDPSEVTMFKCDSCSYQAKQKINLGTHLLTHKDPSELTVYKCYTCSFQTKYKSCLKEHLLRHKDPSEVTMFKCDSCLYETTRSRHLKRHSLKHKDPSEVTVQM